MSPKEGPKLLGYENIKTTERRYAKWMKGRQDRLDALSQQTGERRPTDDNKGLKPAASAVTAYGRRRSPVLRPRNGWEFELHP